jgi:hypothetical protein
MNYFLLLGRHPDGSGLQNNAEHNAKGIPPGKLPAAIAFGHDFPVRVHKNNASLASGFCDFSRTMEKPCNPSTN